LSADSFRLAKGTRLGDYEIQSLLGAGGMGEVYRARDLRLRRDVAIKVLPASFASDPERLRRFEQEATAAAALNHPNILAVYQMGNYEGAPFLVAELLEGETLREEMTRGPIAVRKVSDYGAQIARGLAAAHEKGIVHRDLKPENLFVTPDERVKILDFGLAKLTEPQAGSPTSAPTVGTPTDPGVVMGTAGYMAPEQVRGDAADHRADVFAFGAILYEMIAGRRAFQKATSAETMTAILKEDPANISQIAPASPLALQRVVNRCLEKNPERRFQSASDLAFALEALSDAGTSSSVAREPDATASVWKWRWLAGVVAAFVVLAGILAWLSTPARPPRVLSTTQLTHDGMKKLNLATDGARLYVGESGSTDRIVQVSVNGGDTSPIPTPFANVVLLDISPDHTRLLIASHVATEAHAPLWSLPLPSGAPRHLADLAITGNPGGATWSPDGQRLLFTSGADIFEANADGANPHKLVTSQGNQFCPVFSPDGKRIRLSVRHHGVDSLWEMRADGGNAREVLRPGEEPANASCGFWSTDGRYYFFGAPSQVGGNVWVMRDGGGLFGWRRSSPIQLTTGPLGINAAAVSLDDKKLFVGAQQGRAELVRYDPKAQQFVSFLSGISAGELDYSRDGQWVTYILYPDQTLWRSHSDGSDRLQLTFAPVSAGLPRFSPDGTQIAYIAHQEGQKWKVYLVPRDGGSPQDVADTSYDQADPSWSSDGKKLAFGRFGAIEAGGIHLVDLATRQISDIPGSEKLFSGRWSPDGQYMAALTTDSTKLMMFNFKTQTWSDWVTEPGAFGFPSWSADSQYLYYDITFTENGTFRRVKVGQSRSELVADLKGLLRYSTPPAFQWSGVTPDGAALFVRDLSTDEVYALDLELP
jgi:serine/threonine protein kinase/Tol biopolymer transport system component